jgi:hypothetical protein
MFKDEKTNLFWTGLIILGFASLVVFTAIWQIIISYINYLSYSNRYNTSFAYSYVWSYIPIIAGSVIFILIGGYMLKSGVRKEQLNTPKASQNLESFLQSAFPFDQDLAKFCLRHFSGLTSNVNWFKLNFHGKGFANLGFNKRLYVFDLTCSRRWIIAYFLHCLCKTIIIS